MQETFTYTTAYTADSFKIFKDGNLFVKLFKTSWIGWTLDYKFKDKHYRITRTGWWAPKVSITEKENHQELASIKVRSSFLGFNPGADLQLSDGK